MANQPNPENPRAAQQNQQNPNERAPGEQHRQNQQQQGNPQRQPGQNQDAQRQQQQGNPRDRDMDRDMVGKDTDGDGKVVQPGQKPGQSHGTGIKPDQKR